MTTWRQLLAKFRDVINMAGRPARLRNRLLLRAAYLLRLRRVPVLPIHIDIEPINICNFSCDHCQVTHWNKPKAQLNLIQFQTIVDQLPNLDVIKLQGMGEPLLNKQLIACLEEGERRGINMFFHTNGSVCTPEIAARFASLRRTKVVFSIDGATDETFERVRIGSRFNRVVANIRTFSDARARRKKRDLVAWTVVTRDNVHELPDIVRLCSQLGLEKVSFQPFISDWGKLTMQKRAGAARVNVGEDFVAESVTLAQSTAKEQHVAMEIKSESLFTKQKPCPWPWTSAFISASGDVVPCCVIADAEVACMGNVFRNDFAEIWNSPTYSELRTRIAQNDLPSYCRNCYAHPEAQHVPRAIAS